LFAFDDFAIKPKAAGIHERNVRNGSLTARQPFHAGKAIGPRELPFSGDDTFKSAAVF